MIKISVSKPKEEPFVFNSFNKNTNMAQEETPKPKHQPPRKKDLEWPDDMRSIDPSSPEASEYDYNTTIDYSGKYPRLLPYTKYFMRDGKLTQDEFNAFLHLWSKWIYNPEKEQKSQQVRNEANKKLKKLLGD